ncbi:MerR family transcriptional regulator [Lacticaseibacillus parakribbianus]|uniref:MerR family transcriptional regulator n=1 Tax=Lacticaseibacillus parakribbianus TaxID=2970927 RepID=UPI0021CB8F57|nr:MerR family transcriptional regulator [Lacticaseibacillus parakribbianus]
MNIQAVADTLAVSADTLRYWERVGVIPPVPRTAAGYRTYGPAELDWCNFAKCMRNAGVSIEALCDYIALYQAGPQTAAARKQLLQTQLTVIAARLQAVQGTYDRLAAKIEHYDEADLNPFAHHTQNTQGGTIQHV